MKINGIILNQALNIYGGNKKEHVTIKNMDKKDSIEISSAGKSLSSYSPEDKFISSEEKIESIRKAVENGTYNVDKKLVASRILDAMKGKIL
ncbi:flagellar biosynthesis anti-sigma factor FlgM [Clostridium sp. MT-14]|jgi:negative regulator of flagellin synthesis FlgM|uniref:Negative regulator of flagellin synthesis n=1 Tax=Clostridium aromativorans TaxID=2836848 RepID=A0ABS8N251_9CLOT|nr:MULTISPECIES: flagellar biosynthesis anti-sigma factor FlgM [Clostridium]KAA8678162.1 flagellar biosynthesis anti-sigma factor FlgM [Clostridium sp. HV4-5-A1G]MCC9293886.1 flagellar biosynthesis anti-sigma factor FlgM [Clostridium aromativorans]CAB1241555.1 Anti-sigma-28 factor, FlgM [Clostridiaceae bacterium BL-3]